MAIKYLDAKRLQGTNAERLALTTNLPAWEDSTFSSWSADSSGDVVVTGSEVVITPADPSYGNAYHLGFDLQDATALDGVNLSNTSWVFQFTIDMSTWSVNGTCDYRDALVAISDGTDRTGDFVEFGASNTYCSSTGRGLKFALKYNKTYESLIDADSSGNNETFPSASTVYATSQGSTYGIRITRSSSSAFKMEIWTNTSFTGSASATYDSTDTTLCGNVNDLRYVWCAGYKQASATGSLVMKVDNMKIWNGTTSTTAVYPSLPNGTIFNETDTYKYFMWNGTDTWNQMVSS
jgi:hypothetical protein